MARRYKLDFLLPEAKKEGKNNTVTPKHSEPVKGGYKSHCEVCGKELVHRWSRYCSEHRKIEDRNGIATITSGEYDAGIIECARKGLSQNQMARRLNLTQTQCSRRLTQLRKMYDAQGNVELITKFDLDKSRNGLTML